MEHQQAVAHTNATEAYGRRQSVVVMWREGGWWCGFPGRGSAGGELQGCVDRLAPCFGASWHVSDLTVTITYCNDEESASGQNEEIITTPLLGDVGLSAPGKSALTKGTRPGFAARLHF